MRNLVLIATLAVIAACGVGGRSASSPGGTSACLAEATKPTWVGSWASSPVSAGKAVFGDGAIPIENQTFRAIVHPHFGGCQLRIKLSNAFGQNPLTIGRVTVGYQDEGAALVPGSLREALFGGKASTTVPAGADALSDPVDLPVEPFRNLAISIHVPGSDPAPTNHWEAHQTSYISTPGDHAGDEADGAFAATTTSWYYVSAVDVLAPWHANAIVAFGDSITDGSGSTLDANRRWPDLLARRLLAQPQTGQMSVLNAGIGGNQVVSGDSFGVNALARLDRDVIAQTGVTDVIVLEGINDINFSQATADSLIAGYRQIIAQLHAQGINVIGATLTPNGNKPSRDAVNEWIRTSGEFDGVIDFDTAVRNPDNPNDFRDEYDSGDNLHPSDAGYEAMANAIDLSIFKGRGPGRTRVEVAAADGCSTPSWVVTWATAQQTNRQGTAAPPTAAGFENQTMRNIVRTTVGGSQVRVRLANTFGDRALTLNHVTVALRDDGASVVPESMRELTFSQRPVVTIPPGGRALSDPVELAVPAGADLAVSLFALQPTGPTTGHFYGLKTNYYTPAIGDHAADTDGAAFTLTTTAWAFVDAVDVLAPRTTFAVVPIGDSITDGTGSTVDANTRWPDFLARRLLARGPFGEMGVTDHGIGGNRVLVDSPIAGESTPRRLDRDVIAQTGVTDVIFLEGINDINAAATADQLIDAIQQVVARAKAKGLRIHGGVLTPNGVKPERDKLNEWIRTSGVFDGVVDFDAAVRDPANPNNWKDGTDNNDNLHGNDVGYELMGNTVSLTGFQGTPCR